MGLIPKEQELFSNFSYLREPMSQDPWDDWETAADAGLIDCNKPKTSNQKLWEKANEYSSPVIIHTNTDFAHVEYKPAMKILKRPQGAASKKEAALNTPVKPLAVREKDYEEAKRKIAEKFEHSTHKQ